jgi:putative transposase
LPTDGCQSADPPRSCLPISGETKAKAKAKPDADPKPGWPRTEEAIREVIVKLARETGWGNTRILGELKKLGVRTVSRSTVVNILREHGIDPGPKRGEGTWDEFVKRHAQTLWACDFFARDDSVCVGPAMAC